MALTEAEKRERNRRYQADHRRRQKEADAQAYADQRLAYDKAYYDKHIRAPETPRQPPVTEAAAARALRTIKATHRRIEKELEKPRSTPDLSGLLPAAAQLPELVQGVTAYRNCAELGDKIVAREEEVKKANPKYRKPQEKQTRQAIKIVSNLYKRLFDGKTFDCESYDWARDTPRVLQFIDETWSNEGTKNSKRMALAGVLRNLDGFQDEYTIYSEASTKANKEIIAPAAARNVLKPTQRAVWQTLPELIKARAKAEKSKAATATADAAILSLYVDQPTRRVEDFQLMKVYRRDSRTPVRAAIEKLDRDFNHVIVGPTGTPEQFVYFQYKTQSKYGEQDFEVPKKVAQLLGKHINKRGSRIETGNLLFPNQKGDKDSGFGSRVANTVERYSPLRTTATVIRHAYITDYLAKKRSVAERQKVATAMAHDVGVQAIYEVIEEQG